MTQEEIDQDTIDMLEYPLKHYIRGVFRGVMDYEKMVLNREEVTEGIYKYDTPDRPIYLGDDGYAVTYDRQRVTNGKVYYKFTDLLGVDEDTAYEYVADFEWKKTERHYEEE